LQKPSRNIQYVWTDALHKGHGHFHPCMCG